MSDLKNYGPITRGIKWGKTWHVCTMTPSECFEVRQCQTPWRHRRCRGSEEHPSTKLPSKLGQIPPQTEIPEPAAEPQRLFASAFKVAGTSEKVRGLAKCQKHVSSCCYVLLKKLERRNSGNEKYPIFIQKLKVTIFSMGNVLRTTQRKHCRCPALVQCPVQQR